MLTSALWIRNNMLGNHTQEPEKTLSEAKERVQRCIDQLEVPEWYQKCVKPAPKILKNTTPIECRPASWKTYLIKRRTPRKTPKKSSPKKNSPKMESPENNEPKVLELEVPSSGSPSSLHSPKDARPETPRISSVDSGCCEDCCLCRQPFRRFRIPFKPISSSSSSDEESRISPALKASELRAGETPARAFGSLRTPLNTYPRMTPSRKIQNINIVFPKSFPAKEEEPESLNESIIPRVVDELKKERSDLPELGCDSSAEIQVENEQDSHNSTYVLESEEESPQTPDSCPDKHNSTYVIEEEEEEPRSRPPTPSPAAEFFDSLIESLTKQSSGNGSFVRKKIEELNSSVAERSFTSSVAHSEPISHGFVRNRVEALERGEDDRYSVDSELARSTSISLPSSDDEGPATPPPSLPFQELREEERDIHWIPNRIRRSSSRLCFFSDFEPSQQSPGLSPVQGNRSGWGMTYRLLRGPTLISIDETRPLDSGFSDRSGRLSRIGSRSSYEEGRRSRLPAEWYYNNSASESLLESSDNLSQSGSSTMSGPYVLRSFYV